MKILTACLAAVALTACTARDVKPRDTTLARDLALANQSAASQPQFRDTVLPAADHAPTRIDNPPRTRSVSRPESTEATQEAPPPITSAPAPAAAATPAPATQAPGPMNSSVRQISMGMNFTLATQQRLCTTSNRPGDRFSTSVKTPVSGSNGAVIPAGATMVMEVVSVSPSSDPASAAIAVRTVSVEFNGMTYPVDGDATIQTPMEQTRLNKDPNANAKKVVGGAIVGAIIGQLIGHSTKGTVIGAAAGAGAGAVAAKATEHYESCLPMDGVIRVTLNQPLVL